MALARFGPVRAVLVNVHVPAKVFFGIWAVDEAEALEKQEGCFETK